MSRFMELIKKVNELETVNTVESWKDERKKAEYIQKVMVHKEYCGRSIVQSNIKMRSWCAFLDGYIPPVLPSTAPQLTTTAATNFMNKSRIPIPNHTWNNSQPPYTANRGTGSSGCYDDFNCDTPDLASLNHYLMGVLALTLCVIGVLANTLCVPSFNIHANRSSATFYMTGIAVCDTLVLILATLALVMKNVPVDFAAQQKVYKTFSGYLIPSAMPALELCELMSFWIVIALLVDRFLYLRYGFHSKAICSRSLCAKVMLSIFGLLALYTAPKCLQYKVVELPIAVSPSGSGSFVAASATSSRSGVSLKTSNRATPATPEIQHEVKVMLTQISGSDTYRNLMTHWLKVPVEMFIPLLILGGFTGYFLFKVVENRGAWYRQIAGKRNRQTPPAISNPLRSLVTERQVRQENVNILIALAIGLLVLVCKMPKFVAHVLMSETGHTPPSFQIAVRFLDLLCASLKPALYLGVGDHLHRGILGMFWPSCRAHEESAHEEIARVHMDLNHVNSMAAIAAAAATNGTTAVSGPPEEYQPLNPSAGNPPGPNANATAEAAC